MSPNRKIIKKVSPNYSQIILVVGISLIAMGLLLLTAIFFPMLTNELTYQVQSKKTQLTSQNNSPKEIQPIDATFGIVIPKIRANATVIANVDPYNSQEYQLALTKGVAHARGSAYPGRAGNVFIFSHSSVNFFEALRYNSVFYLLDKLEAGDEINLYYNKEKFVYRVIEKKLVDANMISYLTEKTNIKLVTLMTCWPPGTTFKRLIIQGILQEH